MQSTSENFCVYPEIIIFNSSALWENFLSSVSGEKSRPTEETSKLVKIVKTHRFAGDNVTCVSQSSFWDSLY